MKKRLISLFFVFVGFNFTNNFGMQEDVSSDSFYATNGQYLIYKKSGLELYDFLRNLSAADLTELFASLNQNDYSYLSGELNSIQLQLLLKKMDKKVAEKYLKQIDEPTLETKKQRKVDPIVIKFWPIFGFTSLVFITYLVL